jgi:serine/threonine protein kinase
MIENGKVLQQRYRIDRQIGQGGMGAVYVATDERFGSTVAIKETLFMDGNYRKAIEREARLLNSLKHAALPRVSDHFLEENVQFLVMEYIPGEDLSNMLEGGIQFDVDRVLKWADQLLDALDFLHNQSIPVIHRDIKPQNLKITARDQIILLDFGLAKGNPTDAGHQTAAKSIFGYSRNYASIEQIQGTGTDPRSDLYSLAATLYHLLTGAPPDDALTRAMAVLSSKPDSLLPANVLRQDVSRGAAGVLQKALSLNADDRPATAAEMREMLRDSDAYGYLAEPVTISVPRPLTDALGQQTKLMPSADTRQEFSGQTDVKTAVMPGFPSQATNQRPAKTRDVAPGGKRRGMLIGGALASVLIVSCSAAGLYYYDSAVVGADRSPQAVAEPANKAEPAVPADENLNSAIEAPEIAADPDVPETVKPNSSARTEPKAARDPRSSPDADISEPDLGDVRVEGSNVYLGNVKITPNRPIPNAYVDRNGVRRPIPPIDNEEPFPGITREQFKMMSPKQQRQLLEARRQILQLQRGQKWPRPADVPTPEDQP